MRTKPITVYHDEDAGTLATTSIGRRFPADPWPQWGDDLNGRIAVLRLAWANRPPHVPVFNPFKLDGIPIPLTKDKDVYVEGVGTVGRFGNRLRYRTYITSRDQYYFNKWMQEVTHK